jgi:hypothetical protein
MISDLSNYLKSGGLEKDRPGTDQIKEILEALHKVDLSLSCHTITPTVYYEGAVARLKVLGKTSPYLDTFKFPDGSYGFFIAEPITTGLESTIYLSTLRGMVRTIAASTEAFSFTPFMTAVQKLVQQDPLNQKYAIALLVLHPFSDELRFVSCGIGTLFHITPTTDEPRRLNNINPPLSSQQMTSWDITTGRWSIGDILILHTLPSAVETIVHDYIQNSIHQSPQSQVDNLIYRIAPVLTEKKPFLSVSIHRIG